MRHEADFMVTDTQNDYRNPCACALTVKDVIFHTVVKHAVSFLNFYAITPAAACTTNFNIIHDLSTIVTVQILQNVPLQFRVPVPSLNGRGSKSTQTRVVGI